LNLLFICSRNQWRSPTAECIFRSSINHTKSAGTSDSARKRLTENYIRWADVIFAMEKKHKQIVIDKFSHLLPGKTIVVLHIEDEYPFMDEELIDLLEDTVRPHLSEI
jgi:predicted protein tyrosine phosphatase